MFHGGGLLVTKVHKVFKQAISTIIIIVIQYTCIYIIIHIQYYSVMSDLPEDKHVFTCPLRSSQDCTIPQETQNLVSFPELI